MQKAAPGQNGPDTRRPAHATDAEALVAPARRPRLAVLGLRGLDHFLPDLVAGLAADGAVETRSFTVTGRATLDAALAWADDPARDALWFEFCWPPLPDMIAQTEFNGRRVIVRVHRIEAYEAPHVARAPWHKVDDVVTVSQDMAAIIDEAAPSLRRTTRLHVIHNGVDLARFAPAALPPDPFRIGWCGNMIARKNATLALEVLARLLQEDPRWRLHIVAGQGERLIEDAVLHLVPRMGLGGAVRYDGALPADAMPGWHARNGVLLSTSLHESFGYAIAEAAAVGSDIAVLDHRGAAEFWPDAVRFATVDQAVQLITAAQPGRWRDLVATRFGLDRQVAAVRDLVLERAATTLTATAPAIPATPAVMPPATAATGAPAAPPRAEARGASAGGFSSAGYWEERYRRGATSGAGSYGRLATFKAEVINGFTRLNAVSSVLELGCGDGHQLGLLDLPVYTGVDVSGTVLAQCRALFAGRPGYAFHHMDDIAALPQHDLALSLDVIYHLVEDAVFERYLDALFGHAGRFVLIYASNLDAGWTSPHVRHRRFTEAVRQRHPRWRLASMLPNPYPYRADAPDETSFADVFVYAAPGQPCVVPAPPPR